MTLDPHTTAEILSDARVGAAETDRFIKVWAVIAGLVVVAEVALFGWANVTKESHALSRLSHAQATILAIEKQVRTATDPNSAPSQQAKADTTALVDHLIACIENDDARLAALVGRVPLPPLVAGCPTDSLAPTTSTRVATGGTTAPTRTATATVTTVPCVHPGKQRCTTPTPKGHP